MASIFDQAFDPSQYGNMGGLSPEILRMLQALQPQGGGQFPQADNPQMPPNAMPAMGPPVSGPQMPFQPNQDNPERDFFNPASGMNTLGSPFNPQPNQMPPGGPPQMPPIGGPSPMGQPPMMAQGPPTQSQAPQQPGPGILGNIGQQGGGLLNSILGGAGTMLGDAFKSPALRNGVIGNMFVQGDQRRTQGTIQDYMISKGVSPQDAQFLMANPEAAKAWVAQHAPIGGPNPIVNLKTGNGEISAERDKAGNYKIPNISGYQPTAKLDDVKAIQTMITGRPEFKVYAELAPIYKTMIETAPRNNKASDLNLVYGLAKMFDPQGVVREGDTVQVKNTAAMPSQLLGYINAVNGGAALDAPTREAILAEARTRMEAHRQPYNDLIKQVGPIAQRYGVPLSDITGQVPELPTYTAPPKPAGPLGPIQDEIRRRGLRQ